MKNNMLFRIGLALTLVAGLLCAGCYDEVASAGRKGLRAAYGADSKNYQEFPGDPIALATMKTVAFVPFDSVAPQDGFNPVTFTTSMASQLATRGQVKVVYPQEILKLTDIENRKARQHNVRLQERMMMGEDLGKLPREERTRMPMLDPVRDVDDAVKLGRMLKADAIVMGSITDFDPYNRPQMCLSVKVIATGNSDVASNALAELTQWGVPRSATTARGVIWYLQQNFDSRDSDTGRDAWGFALARHTDDSPSDTDAYLLTISRYYDFVGNKISLSILQAREKAILEAQARALAEAQRQRLAQEGVRNKIRALTDPHYEVPDQQAVMNRSLQDDREKGWRPDIYNLQHPDKKQLLDTNIDPRLVQEQISAMQ